MAWNSPKAASAKAALEKFGIGIDDAENGVFLPATKDSPFAGTGPTVHVSLHTDAYFRAVNSMLERATTRQEALDDLDNLRLALDNGWSPR